MSKHLVRLTLRSGLVAHALQPVPASTRAPIRFQGGCPWSALTARAWPRQNAVKFAASVLLTGGL